VKRVIMEFRVKESSQSELHTFQFVFVLQAVVSVCDRYVQICMNKEKLLKSSALVATLKRPWNCMLMSLLLPTKTVKDMYRERGIYIT
jgi:hypothetical protein